MKVKLHMKNGKTCYCEELDSLNEWGKIMRNKSPVIINEAFIIWTSDIEMVEISDD